MAGVPLMPFLPKLPALKAGAALHHRPIRFAVMATKFMKTGYPPSPPQAASS